MRVAHSPACSLYVKGPSHRYSGAGALESYSFLVVLFLF